MISKMRQDEVGSRIGIVMNGSPLFKGGAGSGESEIRRWMLESDWVEAIVALPTDLFYNTGIQTYVWLLTNRKPKNRRGKVQLIDASSERFWKGMRRSLGSKRREIPEDARKEIVRIYAQMLNGNGEYGEFSKIFDLADSGYREIRVERPLHLAFEVTAERLDRLKLEKPFVKLDPPDQESALSCLGSKGLQKRHQGRDAFEKELAKACKAAGVKLAPTVKKVVLSIMSERDDRADICRDSDGRPEPDTDLRDFELVPLNEGWESYVAREVTPFVQDAWVDETYRDMQDGKVGRVGYEINFNRYFYRYIPPPKVSTTFLYSLFLDRRPAANAPQQPLRDPRSPVRRRAPAVEKDAALDVVAVLIALGARHGIGEDHEGTVLSFADVGVDLKRLLERHPDGRGVALGHGLAPEKQDVDAAVRGTVVEQRPGDLAGRVFGVPGFHPRADALLEVRNDPLGHARVNVFGEARFAFLLVRLFVRRFRHIGLLGFARYGQQGAGRRTETGHLRGNGQHGSPCFTGEWSGQSR